MQLPYHTRVVFSGNAYDFRGLDIHHQRRYRSDRLLTPPPPPPPSTLVYVIVSCVCQVSDVMQITHRCGCWIMVRSCMKSSSFVLSNTPVIYGVDSDPCRRCGAGEPMDAPTYRILTFLAVDSRVLTTGSTLIPVLTSRSTYQLWSPDALSRPNICAVCFEISIQPVQCYQFSDPSDFRTTYIVNLLTPNVNYSGRTAPLTSKVAFYIFIQQI